MDLTTARLEVRERIGELSANFFTDSEVDRAVQDAVRRFNAEEQWPWLYTEWTDVLQGSMGDDTLLLPDDISINRIFNVSISGGSLAHPVTLERVDPAAGFRLRFAYDTFTSHPTWYYLTSAVGDVNASVVYTIRFVPVPDRDYDVEGQYLRTPTIPAGANDLMDCPEEYADAIPAWAAGKLFLKELSISNKAAEQFGLYGKVLDQARHDTLSLASDMDIAWGREHPERRFTSRSDYILGRVPPTLGP